MEVIEFKDVTYYYPETTEPVLKNLNFTIHQGEFIGIVGATGTGKTTLCLTLCGLIPTIVGGKLKGEVNLKGMNTKKIPLSQIVSSNGSGKSVVAITFQDPESQIVGMSVEEDLAFGLENAGVDSAEINRRIDEALESVNMGKYRKSFSYSLSGGQKQRVAIASAIAMKPDILILDEPTSELDPIGREEVFSVIKRLKEETNLTIIIVEHEVEELVKFSDRILVLNKGEIEIFDTPDIVYSNFEVVEKCGIRMPEITELGYELNKFLNTNSPVLLTEDDAENVIWNILNIGDDNIGESNYKCS